MESLFLGSTHGLAVRCRRNEWSASPRRPLTVRMAISKPTKVATVEKVKKELEDCKLIASINYKTFTVKQFADLRKRLPDSCSLVVCKNSLIEKAIEGTSFEALRPAMVGMNAFLFVHTEEIPVALKPFREMQKELKLESNDYTGAVMEGVYYAPDRFTTLETLPSRAEIYAKLLGLMKGPSAQVVGVIQAPARDLVLTLKAYVAKLEEGAASAA